MFARSAIRFAAFSCLGLALLATSLPPVSLPPVSLPLAPNVARAEEEETLIAAPSKPARPAKALAGDLVRERPANERRNEKNLLNKIDLAKDVVYATDESPIPEDEQFQFIDGFLRTPAKGDARLVLPVEVPDFYNLSIYVTSKDPQAETPVGIGAVMSGFQFFVEVRASDFSLSQIYNQKISGPMYIRDGFLVNPQTAGMSELLVSDFGMLLKHHHYGIEWIASGPSLSLEPKWEMSEKDKIFFAFPGGQCIVRKITLESLTREQWIEQVKERIPNGQMAWASKNLETAKIRADIEPLPDWPEVRRTILMQSRRGDFDELERWAKRFRKSDLEIEGQGVAEKFYDLVAGAYAAPNRGAHGRFDAAYQVQFAFLDAWLKHKPDSAAARIIKGRSYLQFAWDVGALTFADDDPGPSQQLFLDRLKMAEEVLDEAAALKPRDACVFSSLLAAGSAAGWGRNQMYETLERGLQISPIDFTLIDHMTKYLLSRPRVGENELGGFAAEMEERIGGKDGQAAYGRIALVAQVTEIHRKRYEGAPDSEEFDFVDPELVRKQFSVDRLRAAIPVMLERRGKEPQVMNYLCWLCCVLDDRQAARQWFATLVDKPDLDIWEWRDRFDHWRHWADPTIPEPSEFLPVDGEEIAGFQAYCDGPVDLAFVRNNKNVLTCSSVAKSTVKNWNLAESELKVQFGSTDGVVIPRSFQRLANGHLIVRMQRDDETETVEYEDGKDGVQAHRPTSFCGIPFNLIADNSEVAAVLTDHDITIHNQVLQKRETVPMPKLSSAAFSPNGQYLLGIGDKLHVWDGMASKELFAIAVEAKFANFSPDSSAVIYATADKLVVWDIAGNRDRFALPLERKHQVQAALMTYDGRFLVSAERQAGKKKGGERHFIALYDLKHSEPVHVFDGHKQAVVRLAVARDDGRLASSSDDGIVKVWDLAAATTAK